VSAEREQLMLSPQLTQALARNIRQQTNTAAAAVSQLTGRELEILGLIAAGSANKHIARDLGISEATVKVHVKHLPTEKAEFPLPGRSGCLGGL